MGHVYLEVGGWRLEVRDSGLGAKGWGMVPLLAAPELGCDLESEGGSPPIVSNGAGGAALAPPELERDPSCEGRGIASR